MGIPMIRAPMVMGVAHVAATIRGVVLMMHRIAIMMVLRACRGHAERRGDEHGRHQQCLAQGHINSPNPVGRGP